MSGNLLIEISSPSGGSMFIDDSGAMFIDDANCIFDDTTGVMRISTENFNGITAWSNDVLNIEPIQWRCDNLHGGMVRIGGMGSIEISMKVFSDLGWWFPATSYPCRISHTSTLEDEAVILMDCTLHLFEINPPLSFRYNIFPENYDVDLLTTGTDINGETVVFPMAFGAVTHVIPVEVDPAHIGFRAWDMGGLTGTNHSNWHVYDDGVDVCWKFTEIQNGIIQTDYDMSGQITISGTKTTLQYADDIFTALCGSSYLNIGLNTLPVASYAIDRWQTEQIRVLDFLSKIAASETWMFYILAGICTAQLMSGVAPYLYINVEADTLDGQIKYTMPDPISLVRTKWKKRTAVEETIGKYVKETNQEEFLTSLYAYGQELEIDTFTETRATAAAKIAAIEGYQSIPQVSATLPFVGDLIFPGTRIYLTDERYTGHVTDNKIGYIRNVQLDFMNKKITIEGHGTFNQAY